MGFFSESKNYNNNIAGIVTIEVYLSTALNGMYWVKLAEPKLKYNNRGMSHINMM